MGYISIQINKAKGSADTGASDHTGGVPRRCGRPHRSDKPPHPHGRHQTKNYSRPSEGNPHRAFGYARGHGESAGRGKAGRVVRRQPAMAAPHIRQGEHRFGGATHGRAYAAHPCYGRTDSDG